MSGVRVAVDIGGTFTDVVTYDEAGREFATTKVLSTPGELERGVIDGVQALVPDLAAASFAVHGTTVGLNALLERRGASVLLLTTAGMRDTYLIARGSRPRERMYDSHYRRPAPLVRRRDILEIGGRIDYRGEEVRPLRTEDLDVAVERVREQGFSAVAIAFLFSYVNPEHELAAGQYLAERLPDVSIVLSHRVAREWREYERTASTVTEAYIAPVVQRYLGRLSDGLAERSMDSTLHIMQSNGGVTTAAAAGRRPLQTLLSGPVGGCMGGAALAAAGGRRNLLCIDVGGTSSDVSLIIDGKPEVSSETWFEGVPLLLPVVNIHTIGAGGGSIGFADAGGLRVGPQSAGSNPGPACYGLGGTSATVTDANAVLGRLDPEAFLGGRMRLDVEAASRAVSALAEELDMEPLELAEGIVDVANAKMADAIRTVTVERGVEPRSFAIVAFGGAGPMHAAFLARDLGIDEVIVPPAPGSFSAFGMLHTSIRHDLTRNFYRAADPFPAAALEQLLDELREEGAAILGADGIPDEAMRFEPAADMRYEGQEYSVTVPIPEGALGDGASPELIDRFHEAYLSRYGHANRDAPIEFVAVRVAALGVLEAPEAWRMTEDPSGAAAGTTRPVSFAGSVRETQIVERASLRRDSVVAGPAIVEEPTTTTIVPPDATLTVDASGSLVISLRRS